MEAINIALSVMTLSFSKYVFVLLLQELCTEEVLMYLQVYIFHMDSNVFPQICLL